MDANHRVSSETRKTAFTLPELLVVILVVALLISAVFPVLARQRQDVHAIICINQKRQLCAAWQMYPDDNAGTLVPNVFGGGMDPVYGAGYAQGYLDWLPTSDNTNINLLLGKTTTKLGSYLNGAAYLYKCPSDNYLSSQQKSLGWTQRLRSISASLPIGPGNAESGPWDSIYRHVIKISEFRIPTPAQTWVFLDEHPDSINDPGFVAPVNGLWRDVPASYHEGAATFACADGHVEMHRWTGSLAKIGGVRFGFTPPTAPVGDPDLHWVSYHSPRVSTNSY